MVGGRKTREKRTRKRDIGRKEKDDYTQLWVVKQLVESVAKEKGVLKEEKITKGWWC